MFALDNIVAIGRYLYALYGYTDLGLQSVATFGARISLADFRARVLPPRMRAAPVS